MKITYMSDLHFEFNEINTMQAKARLEGGDVLVLAGDVCPLRSFDRRVYLHTFLETAKERFKHVVAIAGNHEYYGSNFSDVAEIRKYYAKFGVLFLENDLVEIDGVRFFGATLWTDMNKDDPDTHAAVARYMNDFHIIKGFSTFRAAEENRISVEKILNEQPDVVITHHAPNAASIDPKYAEERYGNFGYYSDIDIPASVKLWIHGHVHTPVDYMIGNTRVVANPRGYPGEVAFSNFDFTKTIEIPND